VFQPGHVLQQRYAVIRKIGEGGFGDVFEVRDLMLDQPLAMKTGRPGRTSREIQREVVLLSSLPEHPNVASYLYTRTISGSPCIFMPLAPHGSMRKWLSRLAQRRDLVVQFALALAQGIRQVHSAGVVHGDVKPDNVLVFDGPRPTIADFGISTLADSAKRRGGTRMYLAPESIGNTATPSADFYAWALCVLEAIAGERCWTDGSSASVEVAEWLSGAPADLRDYGEPLLAVLRADATMRSEAADKACRALRGLYFRDYQVRTEPESEITPVSDAGRSETYERRDLAGMAMGPEVLLVRALAGATDPVTVGALRAIEIPSTEFRGPGRLASEVLCIGDILDVLMQDEGSVLLQAAAWSELGLAHAALGDHAAAIDAHTTAIRLAASQSNPETVGKGHRAGYALRLSEAHAAAGDTTRELDALVAIGPADLDDPDVGFEVRRRIANARSDLGDAAGAEAAYTSLLDEIPEHDVMNMAYALHERGVARRRGRKLDESEEDLKAVLAITFAAIEHQLPHGDDETATFAQTMLIPNLTQVAATAAAQLARTVGDAGRIDEAEHWYQTAQRLLASTDIMSDRESEAHAASDTTSRGVNLANAGRLEEAEAAFVEAASRRRSLVAQGHASSVHGLANALGNLTQLRLKRRNVSGALEAATECVQVCMPTTAAEVRSDLCEVAFRCIVAVVDQGRNDGWLQTNGRQLLQDALDLSNQLIQRLEGLGANEQAAKFFDMRASTRVNLAVGRSGGQQIGLLELAVNDFERARDLGSTQSVRWLIGTLGKLSLAHREAGQEERARQVTAQSVALSRDIARLDPDPNHVVVCAEALCLASFAAETNPLDATSLRGEAAALVRRIDPKSLDGHSCIGAARALLTLSVDELDGSDQYMRDGLLGLELILHHLRSEPSHAGFETLSQVAQVAAHRCVAAGDETSASSVVREVAEIRSAPAIGGVIGSEELLERLVERLEDMVRSGFGDGAQPA
jgi:tetratricopeptide (TPR) repeat protein